MQMSYNMSWLCPVTNSASSAVEPAVSSPSLRSHNKNGKQRNQLVQTVGTMIDQADKKCGLLFKQSEPRRASEFHIEGRHQISVTLECVSQSDKQMDSSEPSRCVLDFIRVKNVGSIASNNLWLPLYCIRSENFKCILFPMNHCTEATCILFSIAQMTFTGPGGLSRSHLSMLLFYLASLLSHPVLWRS